MSEVPLLQVEDLVKHYRLPRERLLAAPYQVGPSSR